MPVDPTISTVTSHREEYFVVLSPDGGWGWVVMVASFFCNFFVDGAIYTFGIFLEDIGASFGAHPTTVSMGHSLMTGFSASTGPLVCGIINHYGFRFVGFAGGVITASAFLGSSFITSIVAFIFVLGVIGGLGMGMIFLPAAVVVGYYFDRWRAVTIAFATTGSAVGIIVFPYVIKDLMGDYDWKTQFLFLMGANLCCALLALTFKPIKPIRVVKPPEFVEILSEQISWASTSPSISMAATSHASSAQTETPTIRPMEREDAFLVQSLLSFILPETPSGAGTIRGVKTPIGISLSSMRITTGPSISLRSIKSIHQSIKSIPQSTKNHCIECSSNVGRMIARMLNLKLLKSPAFVLLSVSMFIVNLGSYIPFIFVEERAKQFQVDKRHSSYLYTALGISNACGRLAAGLLTTIPKANCVNVSYINFTICGVACILSIFCRNLTTQLIFNSVFGFTCASISSLRASLVVELLGIDNLTNGFGLLMLFCGIPFFLGVPIAAAIVKFSGDYNHAFIFAGCVFILSGITLMPVKLVLKWEKSKNRD